MNGLVARLCLIVLVLSIAYWPLATIQGHSIAPIMASENIVYVPDNYTSIQEAIDNAVPGTVVVVREGVYNESIRVIGKNDLVITSEGYVVLNGSWIGGDGVVIQYSSNITIAGLKVYGYKRGVVIEGSNGVRLVECTIDSSDYGVLSRDSNDIAINTSTIRTSSRYGVYIVDTLNTSILSTKLLGSGLYVNGSDSVWRSLTVWNTSVNGKPLVYLKDIDYGGASLSSKYSIVGQILMYNTRNIVIEDYTITNTSTGIQLYKSFNVTIRNTAIGECVYGVIAIDTVWLEIESLEMFKCGLIVYGGRSTWETLSIIDSSIDNKPVVYLRDTSYGWERLSSEYSDVGELLLYNVADIVVDEYVFKESSVGAIVYGSKNILFKDMVVESNLYGLILGSSENVTIENTSFTGNKIAGVYARNTSLHIYLSMFRGNNVDLDCIGCNVTLYSPYKLYYIYNDTLYYNYMGNYWSSYTGSDTDSDGVGDTPYSTSCGIDYYPLVFEPSSYRVIGLKPVLIDIISPGNNSFLSKAINITIEPVISVNLDVVLANSSWSTVLASIQGLSSRKDILFNTTMYSDGEYRLLFNYTEPVSMVSYSICYSIVIDNTLPVAEIIYPLNNSLVSGTITVEYNYSDDNLASIVLTVDKVVKQVGRGLYNYSLDTTKLGDGRHSIELTVTDKAGNTRVVRIYIIVDNTPPSVEIIRPLNNTVRRTGTLVINWSIIEDNPSQVILYIDGKPVNVTGSTGYVIDLDEIEAGMHNITVVVYDKVGHMGSATIFFKKLEPFTPKPTIKHNPGLLALILVVSIILVAVISLVLFKKK